MTQQHGRRFEHELVNGLDEITPEEVWVTSAGYSGNATADDCDLVVTIDPKLATSEETTQYNIEAKKRTGDSGNRVTVFGGSSGDETGVDELRRLAESTPEWADPIVAIKFDRRKLSVLDARWVLSACDRLDYPIPSGVNVHEARLTPSESVSMVKPTLDTWESSRAAQSDAVVLAEKLGVPYNNE